MKRIISRLLCLALTLGVGIGFAAEPILVVGHKNPDTDSFVAAIAVAHLKSQQGVPAIAVSQGEPNPETRYVFDTFQLSTPPIQTSVAGRKIILVDHSDYPQAPDDVKKAEIVGLVDHHKLGGLSTDSPIEIWAFPVGSSSTIVARMYAFAGIPVPRSIAGGMLGAILSDTVIFKSPTTTPEDRSTASALAKIAGVEDVQALGMKIFTEKSQFKNVSGKDLLNLDLKTFVMSGKKVAVAQLETVDLGLLTPRKDELLKVMADLKTEGYHSVFLMLTDIMKEGSDVLVIADDSAIVESALGVKPQGNSIWIPGLLSRKKQVIPQLEKAYK